MRRLPLFQPSSEHEPGTPRAWHWVVVCAALTVAIFVPLSAATLPLKRRVVPALPEAEDPAALLTKAIPFLFAFALASGISGAIVGGFGRGARWGHAALGGAMAALGVWLVVTSGGSVWDWGDALTLLGALGATGAAFAGLAAHLGRRRQERRSGARLR